VTTAPETAVPGATPDGGAALLDARGITKRFAGITALHEVSLDVRPGELVGLIGPNGAGKTTFFNCLLGMEHPDAGRVNFDGRDITNLPVYKRARLGFGRTFQRLEVFVGLSVLEHFLLADRPATATSPSGGTCFACRARPRMRRDAPTPCSRPSASGTSPTSPSKH